MDYLTLAGKIDAASFIEQTALVRSGQEMCLQRLVLTITKKITAKHSSNGAKLLVSG